MEKAKWRNKGKTVSGRWEYLRGPDCFRISLNSKDPITGEQRCFLSYDDKPEWGDWKRVVPRKKVSK